ncbi:unnamed protein product [Adineta ricciae]|uniref:ADP-ribosylglycohydrolase n=1 Tax=Adineta ricciae TaxID=249248 RepID=A0A814HI91_ADIRI|nr:unnamed protein product [Adineta ricciae]CAF1010537.1 unnamed protein product [Adineta ricciae]
MQERPSAVEKFIRHFRKKQPNCDIECQFTTEKVWFDLQYDDYKKIKKPGDLIFDMQYAPVTANEDMLDKIQGSMCGMALGDALGAHVEFRSHTYLQENPVSDLRGGGTWGLKEGQFTDDTSMALCLAISLITRHDFVPYDQLVRYKWWYQKGYMSSTGHCFDIGAGTRESLQVFYNRQRKLAGKSRTTVDKLDYLSDAHYLRNFNVYCSEDGAAGNGALMRLAPVPLFFRKSSAHAIEYSGISGQITHGDIKAYDACRYYAALICAALNGCTKEQILANDFYKTQQSFHDKQLCHEIRNVAEGSYKKPGGYTDGIRGKGYIVDSLEAALWAFWSDDDSFKKGVLAAINLGDDTDTTAAIYGQLAGAYYGYKALPQEWINRLYAREFLLNISGWLEREGGKWEPASSSSALRSPTNYESPDDYLTSSDREPTSTEKSSKLSKFLNFIGVRKQPKASPHSRIFNSPQPERRPRAPSNASV